jgi:redox-sensing transcriptional repressor
MISGRTVGRLSLYRRLLGDLMVGGVTHVFSHVLADLAGTSAAQVRRDIMDLGFRGTPRQGYDVEGLTASIARFLDPDRAQNVAIVGLGNLGRAITAFFAGRRATLAIAAAFDSDPRKTGRAFHGVRCYPVAALEQQIAEHNIKVAVIAVPAPAAEEIADRLVSAGVRGILNFAPVPLHVGEGVYVEQIDMTMALEKVAFFARLR